MTVPLLTSVDCTSQVHLIVGDNGIASKRAQQSIEASATCLLVSPAAEDELHFDLRNLIEKGQVKHIRREFEETNLTAFGREEVDHVVDMVFVTLSPSDNRGLSPLPTQLIVVAWISSLCKRLRIPVNCADSPTNCTFSLLATYRDGPLQVGVSTSGKVSYCVNGLISGLQTCFSYPT
jgi:uroporphyrin-III C-methyltransferase